MADIVVLKDAGGDFASVNDAMRGLSPFSNDTDLIVSSNIIETGRFNGTLTLNGKKVRIIPDVPHEGDYSKARKIFVRISAFIYLYFNGIDFGAGGIFEISGLAITSDQHPDTNRELVYINTSNFSDSGTVIFNKNICNCANDAGAGGASGVFIAGTGNKSLIVKNNKVFRGLYYGLRVNQADDSVELNLENNNTDNCNPNSYSGTYGGIVLSKSTNAVSKIKNNVSTRNGYADYYALYNSFQYDNNSDSDGTLAAMTFPPGGYNNNGSTIIPGDEFLSLDNSSDDYLKINENSLGLIETGIQPIYALEDITGKERGQNNTYSRGCYEYFAEEESIESGEIMPDKSKLVDLKLLTDDHDIYLYNGDLATVAGEDELVQRIKIKLQFFFAEWFLDTTKGVKYYESILKKNPDVNLVDNIIKATIIEEPEIIDFKEFSSDFDISKREFSVSFVANSTYGEINFNEDIL